MKKRPDCYSEKMGYVPIFGKVAVGFSGGVDSSVLLEVLAKQRGTADFTLSAIHVHHGLSPNADLWAQACEAFCRARDIALSIHRVQVDRSAGVGLEAAARDARLAVFAASGCDVVALAHHRDDQAETVLLQLLRGTGLKGAAAMPAWRTLPGTATRIHRPFLDVSREEILAYARAAGLSWVEDESNTQDRFDRNFLRAEVAPRLDARFPAWRDNLGRFARHAASAGDLLLDLAHRDGVPVRPGEPLPADLADRPRQRNALRAFLEVNGLPMPAEGHLDQMARQLFSARRDARVRVEHGGAALVRHKGAIGIDRGEDPAMPWSAPWRGEAEVALGEGRGAVRFHPAQGLGLAALPEPGSGWHFAPRRGGERIRLEASRPTRTVKNLLQEHGVPPWLRPRLPLLFHGEVLVWVPGVGVAADYRALPEGPGRVPEWLPA